MSGTCSARERCPSCSSRRDCSVPPVGESGRDAGWTFAGMCAAVFLLPLVLSVAGASLWSGSALGEVAGAACGLATGTGMAIAVTRRARGEHRRARGA